MMDVARYAVHTIGLVSVKIWGEASLEMVRIVFKWVQMLQAQLSIGLCMSYVASAVHPAVVGTLLLKQPRLAAEQQVLMAAGQQTREIR